MGWYVRDASGRGEASSRRSTRGLRRDARIQSPTHLRDPIGASHTITTLCVRNKPGGKTLCNHLRGNQPKVSVKCCLGLYWSPGESLRPSRESWRIGGPKREKKHLVCLLGGSVCTNLGNPPGDVQSHTSLCFVEATERARNQGLPVPPSLGFLFSLFLSSFPSSLFPLLFAPFCRFPSLLLLFVFLLFYSVLFRFSLFFSPFPLPPPAFPPLTFLPFSPFVCLPMSRK